MTPEHGAACTLCSVITTAVLEEDPLLEEKPVRHVHETACGPARRR